MQERGFLEVCPLRPTDEIEFDWQQGHVKFDAASAIAYVGFSAQHRGEIVFDNGIAIADIEVVNPKEMPYPMSADENYIAFAVSSEDGAPLATTKRAMLSLVSTSFNSGFELNPEMVASGAIASSGIPYKGMKNTQPPGLPPVLTARVNATIRTGPLNGMKYRLLDWHFKEIGSGTLSETFNFDAQQEIFYIELTR